MSDQKDWLAEAEKSRLTPIECAFEDAHHAEKAAHDAFFGVLVAVRQALDEVKSRLRDE